MAITLTDNVINALDQVNITPQVIMTIEGISSPFTTATIKKYIVIGEDGLYIGDTWTIGGQNDVANQHSWISFSSTDGPSTSTKINQQLQPDKGVGNSVTSLQVALIDKDEAISNMISSGLQVTDMLARRATVRLMFQGTVYPDDAVTIFKGLISDIQSYPGKIVLTIDHPDTKKRQKIFKKATSRMDAENILGTVGGVSLADGGSGYTVGNTLVVANGNGDCIVRVENAPGGVIDTISLQARGSGYRFSTNNACSGGSGTGAKVHITYINEFDSTATEIALVTPDNFLDQELGPSMIEDTAFLKYVKIEDEIIQYQTIINGSLIGCTRGAMNTTATTHGTDKTVESFYRINDDSMNVALKVMLSGWHGNYLEGVACRHIGNTYANSIFFQDINVSDEYGVTVGDYVSIVDSLYNDYDRVRITEIKIVDNGSYIILALSNLSGPTILVEELDTEGVCSFRSKYDVYPDGLKMSPQDVDVLEHERIRSLFLSSFEYDIYLKDSIDGKEFLEREVYLPAAAYSIPRKAKSSVGYTISPIPNSNIAILNSYKIKNPKKIVLRRTFSKYFYNTVIYRFDQQVLSDDLATATVNVSVDSLNNIPIGYKALEIKSIGMRSQIQGLALANSAANRKFNRYKNGAEHFEAIELMFKDGFVIEIGDTIMLDTTNLHITNTKTGTREPYQRLYECINKSFDIKTGNVTVALLDTNFDTAKRYSLVSPSSYIKAATGTNTFILEGSSLEYKKWSKYTNPAISIRKADYSDNMLTSIVSVNGNTIEVLDSIGTFGAGDVIEFAPYTELTEEQKLIYCAMSDTSFGDGKTQYSMI